MAKKSNNGITIGEICHSNCTMYHNTPESGKWQNLTAKEKEAWEIFASEHHARQVYKATKPMIKISERRWQAND